MEKFRFPPKFDGYIRCPHLVHNFFFKFLEKFDFHGKVDGIIIFLYFKFYIEITKLPLHLKLTKMTINFILVSSFRKKYIFQVIFLMQVKLRELVIITINKVVWLLYNIEVYIEMYR